MSGEEPRTGVYICHCGTNIAAVVDVEKVTESAKNLPNVVTAKHYVYMCSQPGQALIKEDIEKLRLNRVVVASCSPRMHEATYRKVLEEAGINPFFFEMANIREHVSWAHMKSPEEATMKAEDLVRMAVYRAQMLEPISKKKVKVADKALIMGAGVAGLTAALDLASRGFEVYLVEREPYVGGNVAQLNRLYWSGEASEYLASLTKQLGNPKIKVLTNSEIKGVEGYLGNFDVGVLVGARGVRIGQCINCGKCAEACPVTVPDKFNYGVGCRKAVYLPYPNAVPAAYVVDWNACTRCGRCVEACPTEAITLDEKPTETTIKAGMIVVTTGFEPYVPAHGEFGYGIGKNVITQLALERMFDKDGPTGGRLIAPSNGETPKTVSFIMCVGSRQTPSGLDEGKEVHAYCSRFCCPSALKNAILVKERHPETEVYVLYRDIRTFGRNHEKRLYRRCRELGILFIRFTSDDPPEVEVREDGRLLIRVKDKLLKVRMEVLTDLLVLVEGMIPRRDVAEVQSKLSITRSPDGFFQEAHPKMNPLDTFADGVYIGGTAQGPKDIIDSVNQASGAAAKAAILLSKGEVLIDLVTAVVDEDLCIGCGKCTDVCPYKAITLDKAEDVAKVIDVKCKGCGSCSATCPVGAVQVRHHKDEQYLTMLEGFIPEEATIHG